MLVVVWDARLLVTTMLVVAQRWNSFRTTSLVLLSPFRFLRGFPAGLWLSGFKYRDLTMTGEDFSNVLLKSLV